MFGDEDDGIDTFIAINNVFCTFNLQCSLDLNDIMSRCFNVEMKERRDYINMQLKKPKADARIHATGRVVCLGTKSEEDAKIASKRFARILQKLDYDVRFSRFKISNIHGTVKLPFPVKIVEFAKAHEEASYEPELHSGVIYKVPQFQATLTIHRTGCLIVFAPSEENIRQAVKQFFPMIVPFAITSPKKPKSNTRKRKSRRVHKKNSDPSWYS